MENEKWYKGQQKSIVKSNVKNVNPLVGIYTNRDTYAIKTWPFSRHVWVISLCRYCININLIFQLLIAHSGMGFESKPRKLHSEHDTIMNARMASAMNEQWPRDPFHMCENHSRDALNPMHSCVGSRLAYCKHLSSIYSISVSHCKYNIYKYWSEIIHYICHNFPPHFPFYISYGQSYAIPSRISTKIIIIFRIIFDCMLWCVYKALIQWYCSSLCGIWCVTSFWLVHIRIGIHT